MCLSFQGKKYLPTKKMDSQEYKEEGIWKSCWHAGKSESMGMRHILEDKIYIYTQVYIHCTSDCK